MNLSQEFTWNLDFIPDSIPSSPLNHNVTRYKLKYSNMYYVALCISCVLNRAT